MRRKMRKRIIWKRRMKITIKRMHERWRPKR
jgi:hypothetical protein